MKRRNFFKYVGVLSLIGFGGKLKALPENAKEKITYYSTRKLQPLWDGIRGEWKWYGTEGEFQTLCKKMGFGVQWLSDHKNTYKSGVFLSQKLKITVPSNETSFRLDTKTPTHKFIFHTLFIPK